MGAIHCRRLSGGIDEGRVAMLYKGHGPVDDVEVEAAQPARTYWRDDTKRGGPERLTRVGSEDEADLVSSLTEDGMHAPTLDIDHAMETSWRTDRPGVTTFHF